MEPMPPEAERCRVLYVSPLKALANDIERNLKAPLAGIRAELQALERAERRLAEGTYGLSIESGEPIPDGRLEIIPWAERTAEEQARYERLGR